jgi:hypothetical protein
MRALSISYVPARRDSLAEFVHSLPCVLYESTDALEIRYVSANVAELLGFEADELADSLFLLKDHVFAQDIGLFEDRLDFSSNAKSLT